MTIMLLQVQAAFRRHKDDTAAGLCELYEQLLWLQHGCRLTLLHCRRCAPQTGG